MNATTSSRRIAIGAALIFVAVSVTLFFAGLHEHSPYILTFVSFPYGYGLFGYTFVAGSQPLFAENTYFLDQVVMFSGAGSRLSMYFTSIRPLYAFLASLLAPLTGVLASLQLLNYLSWALAAYVAWRYTLRLFADRWAAALAVVLVAFGIGFVIHVHDYSPHIFPFAMYYAGTLVVYESGVWSSRRPWRTHLMIGAFLAIASLAYSTGIVLAAAYAAVAIRRNAWRHVAAAVAIGISSQYVWTAALNVFNSLASGHWAWINVPQAEQALMRQSVAIWVAALPDLPAFGRMLVDSVLQFGGLECPLLIAVAAGCWIAQDLSREQRWFDLCFAAMPIAVALVYVHVVITRGYLSYGMSLWIYSTLAGSFAVWLRTTGVRRVAAVLAVTIVIVAQAGWSTSHLRGYLIPIKMFHGFGTVTWLKPHFDQWQMPAAQSLTDGEATPVLFGGAATITEAGAVTAIPNPAPSYTWRFGLVARAVIVIYLAAMALAWLGRRRLVAVAVGAGVIWVSPVLAAKISPLRPTPIYSTFDSESIRAGDTWTYSIDVGPAFLEAARRALAKATMVDFMVAGLRPPLVVRVKAGGEVIASAVDGRQVLRSALSAGQVLGLLDQSKRLEVEIAADHQARIFGWQRPDLPGRNLHAQYADLSAITALPAFEMRFLNSRGAPELIGF
jgi:hypothetical protein